MKNTLSALLLFTVTLLSLSSFSQENNSNPPVIARLHLLSPGFTAEILTSPKSSICTDFNLIFLYQSTTLLGQTESNLYVIPYIRIESRFYYNQMKREKLVHQIKNTRHYFNTFVAHLPFLNLYMLLKHS